MLNITHYYRNANQNNNDLSPYTGLNGHHQKVYKLNSGDGVEKREPSCTIGGNANWYSHYGEQYGFLKKLGIKPPSVQFSHSTASNSLRPHGLQHTRRPCPSPTPGVYSNSCPLSRWCHPTISSSVIPFSSCPQSFLASGSFQMSQLLALGGKSIEVSASTSILSMAE